MKVHQRLRRRGTGVGLSFLGYGFALRQVRRIAVIAFARHRDGNAFRRRGLTHFGLRPG
jgi:hypothetical protein